MFMQMLNELWTALFFVCKSVSNGSEAISDLTGAARDESKGYRALLDEDRGQRLALRKAERAERFGTPDDEDTEEQSEDSPLNIAA